MDAASDRDGDEKAAYAAAAWLPTCRPSSSLGEFFNPSLTADESGIAKIEGGF
jgi:hypothetical protein